jgi:hypothetical protein
LGAGLDQRRSGGQKAAYNLGLMDGFEPSESDALTVSSGDQFWLLDQHQVCFQMTVSALWSLMASLTLSRAGRQQQSMRLVSKFWFEQLCAEAPDVRDRVFSGYVLFLVFGRA